MTLRNPLGSFSALSMAASPEALVGIAVVAGVTVTVAAATYTYKAYKNYEEKKHREAIETINRLHEKHLTRIPVFDNHEIRGFPPIFKLDPDKSSSEVESMHFTDEQVRDIGTTLPRCADIVLSNYREYVLDAILKLKEYYFSRKDHTDITAGVLSYLLHLLESKCLNFEGYDYDIAYLNAITNFINAYASLQDRENSQHFSRLSPVHAYLRNAQQELERHKDALSLNDMVIELRESCIAHNTQLIKSLAKMVVKEKHWDLVDLVTMDELSRGLLRRKYIHSEIKGLVLTSDHEVDIPDSVFRKWVESLAKYYLQTLEPDTQLACGDIMTVEQMFALPDLQRLDQLRHGSYHFRSDEAKEMRLLEDQMQDLRHQFKKCRNFLTTRQDPETVNSTPKYIPVDSDVDLYNRSQVIAQFAAIIHQSISLQYLSTHLLKSIKQLGEIYVKNPQHFSRIFNVLSLLCKQIKSGIDSAREMFVKIQQANRNAMQLTDQELFPEQVKGFLDSTRVVISNLDKRIREYRDWVPKSQQEPTVESVKHEMFEVAVVLARMYHMQPDAIACQNSDRSLSRPKTTASSSQPQAHAKKQHHKKGKTDKDDKKAIRQSRDDSRVSTQVPSASSSGLHHDEPGTGSRTEPEDEITRALQEIEGHLHDEKTADQGNKALSAGEKSEPISLLSSINIDLRAIKTRIAEIRDREVQVETHAEGLQTIINEMTAYTRLQAVLAGVRDQLTLQLNQTEPFTDANSKTDLEANLAFTLNICKRMLDILKLDKPQRSEQAKLLITDLGSRLQDFGRLIQHSPHAGGSQSVTDMGLFRQNSQALLRATELEQITALLAENKRALVNQ